MPRKETQGEPTVCSPIYNTGFATYSLTIATIYIDYEVGNYTIYILEGDTASWEKTP